MTATVSSRPGTYFSTITVSPKVQELSSSDGRLLSSTTIVTPTLDPSFIGLMTKGLSITLPDLKSARVAISWGAQGIPTDLNSRFAMGLSMARAEAITPEWVYFRPRHSSTP